MSLFHRGRFVKVVCYRLNIPREVNTTMLNTYWEVGRGYSRSNLYNMRELYLQYPKIQTTSGKLSWSHYMEESPILSRR
jgi:hypothetical protein